MLADSRRTVAAAAAAGPASAPLPDVPTVPPALRLSGEFEVASVGQKQGRAFATFEARLEHQFAATARSRYAFQVIDARGTQLAASTPAELPGVEEGTSVVRYESPELDDGYYIVRLTAVMDDDNDRSALEREIYLSVDSGDLTPVEYQEFFDNAGVNVGVPVVREEAGGTAAFRSVGPTATMLPTIPSIPWIPGPIVINPRSEGTIRGRLTFYQANGGFCPSDRDCTGSNYRQSAFQKWAPISNIHVELWLNRRIIGRGTTNSNGYYTISWFTTDFDVSNAYVHVVGKHKDDRFFIKNWLGLTTVWSTSAIQLRKGTSEDSPQIVDEHRFGRADSPDLLLNYYDAVEHTWWYALMGSNAIWNKWKRLELRGIYDGTSRFDKNECVETCGSGQGRYIKISPDYKLQMTTVAHELGHVASYTINPFYSTGDYGYPKTCEFGDPYCDGTHLQDSPEWQHVQFEEGFATFVALVALNQAYAPAPHFCTGNTRIACRGDARNMELSIGSSFCTPSMQRQENQVTRYLWDYYDSVDDEIPYSDTVSVPYKTIYDGIALFGKGCAENECVDEQLNTPYFVDGKYAGSDEAPFAYTERDGRNSYDFLRLSRQHYADSVMQWFYNCGYNGNHGKQVFESF